MRTMRTIAVVAVLAGLMVLPGCFLSNLRKKKPAVPPPQAQAPTVTTPATPPPEQPKPSPPPPVSGEPSRPKPEVAPPTTTTEKPKPKRPRTPVAKKTPPPAPVQPEPESAPAPPPKTVVPEGGVTPPVPPQLSSNIGHDAAIHQQMTTAQLLEATDYNLKGISRALNADEQAMVQHIRSFLQQSRDAIKEGDPERAYNLAMKAHLLSDELVKGR